MPTMENDIRDRKKSRVYLYVLFGTFITFDRKICDKIYKGPEWMKSGLSGDDLSYVMDRAPLEGCKGCNCTP